MRQSLIVVLLSLAGCGPSFLTTNNPSDASEQPQSARTEIERGPVKVSVDVRPHPARLSDELILTLEIDYERDVKIVKPPFGESIGDFIIRHWRETLPETTGSREILRQIYTLEPTRTGTLHIAPITVSFTDNRPLGDGENHWVETDAVGVEVNSILESEAASLDDLRRLDGPLELPSNRTHLVWWLAAGVLLAAAAIVVVWLARRLHPTVEEKPLSPRELAYLELQELVDDNLGEKDIKRFYLHLTGIVRRYIERAMNIRAPEQTTEEFLQEINSGEVFPREEQNRLKSFLESADFVKFAAHHPPASDVEYAFNRAKEFVGLRVPTNGRD